MGESGVRATWRLAAKHGLLLLLGGGLVVFVLLSSVPDGRRFRSKQKRESTRACAMQLLNSVNQFQVAYGHYPAGLCGVAPVPCEGPLFAALAGTDAAANPKGVNFLPELRDVTEEYWGPGILRDASGLSLLDAWGRAYQVLVDDDGDGMVMNPEPDGKPALIPSTVLVWSGGKDGDPETWEDNVTSWKRAK